EHHAAHRLDGVGGGLVTDVADERGDLVGQFRRPVRVGQRVTSHGADTSRHCAQPLRAACPATGGGGFQGIGPATSRAQSSGSRAYAWLVSVSTATSTSVGVPSSAYRASARMSTGPSPSNTQRVFGVGGASPSAAACSR